MVAADGYSYERKIILKLFEDKGVGVDPFADPVLSPVTHVAFSSQTILTNQVLKILITKWRRENARIEDVEQKGQVAKGILQLLVQSVWRSLQFWTHIRLWPLSSENIAESRPTKLKNQFKGHESANCSSTETPAILLESETLKISDDEGMQKTVENLHDNKKGVDQNEIFVTQNLANEATVKQNIPEKASVDIANHLDDVEKKPLMEVIAQIAVEANLTNLHVTNSMKIAEVVSKADIIDAANEPTIDRAAASTAIEISTTAVQQLAPTPPLLPAPASRQTVMQPAGQMLLHAIQSKTGVEGANANPFQRDKSVSTSKLQINVHHPMSNGSSSSTQEKKTPFVGSPGASRLGSYLRDQLGSPDKSKIELNKANDAATVTNLNDGLKEVGTKVPDPRKEEKWLEEGDIRGDFSVVKRRSKAAPVEKKNTFETPQSQESSMIPPSKAPTPLGRTPPLIGSSKKPDRPERPERLTASIVEAMIEVPARATGYIVGKQGATLTSIKQRTGAQLSIVQPRKKSGRNGDVDIDEKELPGCVKDGTDDSHNGKKVEKSKNGNENEGEDGKDGKEGNERKDGKDGKDGKEGKDGETTCFLVTGTADSVNTALNDLLISLAKIKVKLTVISMTTKVK